MPAALPAAKLLVAVLALVASAHMPKTCNLLLLPCRWPAGSCKPSEAAAARHLGSERRELIWFLVADNLLPSFQLPCWTPFACESLHACAGLPPNPELHLPCLVFKPAAIHTQPPGNTRSRRLPTNSVSMRVKNCGDGYTGWLA